MIAVSPALLIDVRPFASREDVARLSMMPVEDRVRAGSVYDLVIDAAQRWPDATAIRFLPRGLASDTPVDITFAGLSAAMTRTANLFRALGVDRDDGVAILLPTLPEAHVAVWAAATAGVACPINPLLSPTHIVEIMRAAGVKLIVTVGPRIDAELWAGASAAAAALGARVGVVAGGAEAGAIDVIAERESFRGDALSFPPPRRSDRASVFHTGGTTARPKLVAHTHFNQLVCAVQTATGSDLSPGDTVLGALPINHVIAGIATGLTMLATGARLLIPGMSGFRNPYLLQDFWKIVAANEVTSFSAVPTALVALLGVRVDAELRQLRYVSCGAAPMPSHLIAAFEAMTGAEVIESYGMTEATTMISTNPRRGLRPAGSVGLPGVYVDLRIVAEGSEALCAPGEVGRVHIRGPAVIAGYLGEPPVADSDGWFDTGDIGSIDADGFLFLTGRAKDLIIRSGHNIDPRLVEEALHSHPDVALAAAVGRPDAYAGEVPIVFLTLRDSADCTVDDLLRHARASISERPAAPAEVVVLPAMPMTLLGKVFKPALRAMARARVLDAEIGPIVARHGAGMVATPANDDQTPTTIVVVPGPATDHTTLEVAIAARALALGTGVALEWRPALPRVSGAPA